MALHITHERNPAGPAPDEMERALEVYNASVAGSHDRETVLLTARDDQGILQAGLKGTMGWNWRMVTILWVGETYRRKGVGSLLLQQAEEKAKAYGCTGVFLDTHSFQAPEFYQKQGYSEFGRLENFPPAMRDSILPNRFSYPS